MVGIRLTEGRGGEEEEGAAEARGREGRGREGVNEARGRAKLLKPPIQIRGYIYYRKLAIVENAAQLKKGILLRMAANMCRLRAGCEQWCTLASFR